MVVVLYGRSAHVGGHETWMCGMAGALQEQGHKCILFFQESGALLAGAPPGVEVVLGGMAELLRVVDRSAASIVYAPAMFGGDGLPAVRGLGAKLVVGKVTTSVPPFWDSTACDAVLAVSHAAAAAIQPATDLPVEVVYYGIDTERFAPASVGMHGPPIVGWAGRAGDVVKRIDRLAAVAPDLVAKGCRVWVASPHALEEVDADAGRILQDVVERWQAVPPREMPDFYRAVAASGGCLLHTSEREGLPLTLLEAQACGCPVIGTDVPGVNEAVRPERGGELYPEDEPADQVAERVVRLVSDPAQQALRSEAAATFAREAFSFDRMVDEYLRVFERAPYQPVRPRPGRAAWSPLAPVLHWGRYVEERWPVGDKCYQASLELKGTGDWRPARAALREAWRCCPTLFLRPKRLRAAREILRHGGAADAATTDRS